MLRRGLLFPRGCQMRLSESCLRKVVIGVGGVVTADCFKRLDTVRKPVLQEEVPASKVRFEYRQLCRQVSPTMARFRLCEHYGFEPWEVSAILYSPGDGRG